MPEEPISTFYLPHLVYRLAGQENPFVETMLEEMELEPVYSVAVNSTTESELLDMLTYDGVMGENYWEVDGRMKNFND